MTKHALTCCFILLLIRVSATHIIGGYLDVTYLNASNFEVRLWVYTDCKNGSTNSFFSDYISVNLYDQLTHDTIQVIDLRKRMDFGPIFKGDQCTKLNYCIEEFVFIDTVSLSDNPNGYYLSWESCCRNGSIENLLDPLSSGSVFYIDIPDPALKNSSPKFTGYPELPFFCTGILNEHDLSAIDKDGDSLVYELIDPFTSNCTNCSPPKIFPHCVWKPPFSEQDPLGCSFLPVLDGISGKFSSTPNHQGLFVISYKVDEYRNGKKIGTVIRDFEFISSVCHPYSPFISEQETIEIHGSERICRDVMAIDPTGSKVTLNFSKKLTSLTEISLYQGELTNQGLYALEGFVNGSIVSMQSSKNFMTSDSVTFTGNGKVGLQVCYQHACSMIDTTIEFILEAYGEGCFGSDTAKSILRFKVTNNSDILRVPNVFSPNNDGVNDYWFVDSECPVEFEGWIMNRWGNTIKKISTKDNSWDGKDANGICLVEGVYFCIINTSSGRTIQTSIALVN